MLPQITKWSHGGIGRLLRNVKRPVADRFAGIVAGKGRNGGPVPRCWHGPCRYPAAPLPVADTLRRPQAAPYRPQSCGGILRARMARGRPLWRQCARDRRGARAASLAAPCGPLTRNGREIPGRFACYVVCVNVARVYSTETTLRPKTGRRALSALPGRSS